MADKKLTRRKKKNQGDEDTALTKDEEEVAKNLRFNLETKKSTLLGDEAHYFFGSKAVDFLMDSKWATGCKSSVAFTHRDSVVAFLNRLLGLRYFDHVHVIKTEKKVKKKDGDKKKEETEKKDEGEKKKDGDKKKGDKTKVEEKEKDEKKTPGSPRAKKEKDGKEIKKVRKKVKINLEPHEDQIFFDSDDEAYVWIYDPVSWKTFFFGILLVLAIIAVCLFPLWPESVREYSWYLSVAGAIFVGSILVLAVLRYVIYGVLWVCTVGNLHFWLLPNLTAECGFFESFVPFYEYTVVKSEEKEPDDKNKTKIQSGSEKEKSGSDPNNEKDDDNAVEDVHSSPEVISVNIDNEYDNITKLESCEAEVGLDEEIKHPGVEELVDNEIPSLDKKDSLTEMSLDTIESTKDELPTEITEALSYVDKLETTETTESEESNGSTKEEGWIKVKKGDVSGDDLPKNENEVNC